MDLPDLMNQSHRDTFNCVPTNREGPRLSVWWIPQVPGKPFRVFVNSFAEAKVLIDTLAEYDLFQLRHNIKPDFSNVGGLCIWDERLDADDDGSKWTDWEDEETGNGIDDLTLDECINLDRAFAPAAKITVAERPSNSDYVATLENTSQYECAKTAAEALGQLVLSTKLRLGIKLTMPKGWFGMEDK